LQFVQVFALWAGLETYWSVEETRTIEFFSCFIDCFLQFIAFPSLGVYLWGTYSSGLFRLDCSVFTGSFFGTYVENPKCQGRADY